MTNPTKDNVCPHGNQIEFCVPCDLGEALSSNPVSTEQQRREAFAVFLAALDAKDIPVSMAAAFQAGWDACMRRQSPAVETTACSPSSASDTPESAIEFVVGVAKDQRFSNEYLGNVVRSWLPVLEGNAT